MAAKRLHDQVSVPARSAPGRGHTVHVVRRSCVTGVLAALIVCACAGPASAAPPSKLRVIGGSDATRVWSAQGLMTLRAFGSVVTCGGTLVSARWFLTAGHCVTFEGRDVDRPRLVPPATAFTVTLGRPDLSLRNPADDYRVVDVQRHPGFGYAGDLAAHDVALLHLERPAAATQEPLGIAPSGEPALWAPGTSAIVLGWGRLCSGCPGSQRLQEATIPIVTDAACAAAHGGNFDPALMLCAGAANAGACAGDSGGPLMVGRLGEPVLAGTVTGGRGDCTSPGYPGVFARVGAPALGNWIRAIMPTAAIAAVPASPWVGDVVQLTALAGKPASQPAAPAFSWDLNGDGAFGDASGPVVQAPATQKGVRAVRVQESYPDGDRAVARQVVSVTDAPAPRLVGLPPRVSRASLLDRRTSVKVQCSLPATLKATAYHRGMLLGSGTGRCARAQTRRVTIALTRRGVRSVRRGRRGGLVLRTTVSAVTGRTRLTKTLALRR